MNSKLAGVVIVALLIALVLTLIAGTLGCSKQQGEQEEGLREQPPGTVLPPRPDGPPGQAPGGGQQQEQPEEGEADAE